MQSVKYNFLVDCSETVLKSYINLKVKDGAKIFVSGDLNWCLQSYLILSKRSNIQVECSNRLQQDAINIVHSDQLLKLKGDSNKFIVCVRADYPKRNWAHYHIVQNKNQVTTHTSFIPHWIQPGLVKRDINRKSVVRVAYSGQVFNGNLAGSEEVWKKLFEPHGIEFVTLTEGSWHDLNSVDALIAIRTFDKNPHNTKPPTKLFSAWHAGIPFVGGYDSAFMQVGIPDEDYLLAKNPEEALLAVLKLRDEPTFYTKLVNNGYIKAKMYNENSIAEMWENMLTQDILTRYNTWRIRNNYEAIRFNFFLGAGLLEHRSKQLIKSVLKQFT